MPPKFKRKPPRLERIFQSIDAPLFFVTFTTHGRFKILARPEIHDAFRNYCIRSQDFGIALGCFVIMPDHIHLFVQFGRASHVTLGLWMRGLKRQLHQTLVLLGESPVVLPGQKLRTFWQPGFFDHLLRNEESYAQKWDYVRENPMRARLVSDPDAWPFAGEIVSIDRV